MIFIEKYFNAEKSESLFFAGIGLFAFMAGIYFLIILKKPFYNGMAIPLMVVAMIQITVGITVYFRSPKDISRVQLIIKQDPDKLDTEEISRMEQVMKNFVIYRYSEIALMVTGIVLIFLFGSETYWKGLGWGLFIQATLMLSLDYFAEKRGHSYMEQIRQYKLSSNKAK